MRESMSWSRWILSRPIVAFSQYSFKLCCVLQKDEVDAVYSRRVTGLSPNHEYLLEVSLRGTWHFLLVNLRRLHLHITPVFSFSRSNFYFLWNHLYTCARSAYSILSGLAFRKIRFITRRFAGLINFNFVRSRQWWTTNYQPSRLHTSSEPQVRLVIRSRPSWHIDDKRQT